MTRKTKYPFYLNAGNVLLPFDPDKPLSKWQVIALIVFITLAGAIIIIVALKSRSERQFDCSDSNVKCPTGTTKIPGATYTKNSRNCCTDTTGSCIGKSGLDVEKNACTFNENEYDCTSESNCEWVRPVKTGWKCDTSGNFGNTCYQAVNGPYSTAKECQDKSDCYEPDKDTQ